MKTAMNKNLPDQILNVCKPVGISSYDVVRQVKRLIPGVKIGHGGTLDPFAEGVLLILIGKATRRMPDLLKYKKSYRALLKLGAATETGDHTAAVRMTGAVPDISDEKLNAIEQEFTGDITQIPPRYSAKKIRGKPAYKYAREGRAVQLKPVDVRIYDLRLDLVEEDIITISVTCSSGTYIRVLGEDIARALGTCGHLISLRRTAVGEYHIGDCIEFDKLQEFTLEQLMARASD